MTGVVAVALGLAVFAGPAAAQLTAGPPPVSVGHSGWSWGDPQPQGQDLDAVAFQGATGYAVGALGTVLESSDGGTSWTGLASGTLQPLSLVQELSPTTVIAGGGCSVIESTNGGQSFQSLSFGLAQNCSSPVVGLAFFTASAGYVELRNGTLLYTTDGGRTVQARAAVPVDGADASGLAFSSPTSGIAITASGAIELTNDGGETWSLVASAPWALQAVTVAGPDLDYAVGKYGDFLSSDDGGQTWTTMALAPYGGATAPPDFSAPDLTSIECAAADDCLMTTGTNEVLRTTDGGMTATAAGAASNPLNAVAFTTGSGAVAVGQLGATAVSPDGGQTFPAAPADALDTFTPLSAGDGFVTGGAAGTAYLPGEKGQIAATVDGGSDWSVLRVPTTAPIESVAFSSASAGYALDADGILNRTTDGGTSWSVATARYSHRAQLLTPNASTVLLVGPDGIARSASGASGLHEVTGNVEVHGGSGPAVRALRLAGGVRAGSAIVAWGASGIVASTDTGRRWHKVRSPVAGRRLASVSAVSGSRIWVLTTSGDLDATSDGGRHWLAVPAIGDVGQAEQVSFASRRDGLIGIGHSAGGGDPFSAATVLSTHDGGRTWEPQVVAGVRSLALAATPSADYDVEQPTVAGESPVELLRSTDGGSSPLHSSLRIALAHPSQSPRALSRAHHRLVVRGRLSPVLSVDEPVAISYEIGHGHWRMTTALVATSGAFQVTLRHVDASTTVVAQALGDGAHGGAGSPAARFTVTP